MASTSATVSTATSGAVVAEACVLNLTPPSKIGTGICFLDHMCDQLTSHGQLGVTLRCGVGSGAWFAPGRDYATGVAGRPHDRDIFVACGTALGLALRRVVDEVAAAAAAPAAAAAATFCCPLDEAFAEAVIDLRPPAERRGACAVRLEPYGRFAGDAAAGRK